MCVCKKARVYICKECLSMCVYVCVCARVYVREREKQRERERVRQRESKLIRACVHMGVFVYVYMCEREGVYVCV